ncbi:helix-turn-helix transcriptional regulator, partial [Bacillus altitudinis]|uniref:helix-turn-helix domain-containing protein n=3 Tax=cellular organisms TaxID=131567 RepID=UPI003D26178A
RDDLASKLFVTKQAVYKWEKGMNYPDINNLMKIADIFGVKVDDLLDESRDLNSLKKGDLSMLDNKAKNNLKVYVKLLPWIGLFCSIVLSIYFFVIEGVNYDIGWAVLYCLMPFLIFTAISIPVRIVTRRQSN